MLGADFATRFWQDIVGSLVVLDTLLVVVTLCWVLHTKREAMSAIAWSLTVILVPFLGAVLFALLGSQTIHRKITRRKRRRSAYKLLVGGPAGASSSDIAPRWDVLARLAHHEHGFPVVGGNAVTVYHDGEPAYEAMLEALRAARHHVHLQFFIFRGDASGRRFIDALCECAGRGVQVRFLYDAVGSYKLPSRLVRRLQEAGGHAAAFLPILDPLSRLRVNLRNHRKILIVDGTVGFTGGLNIGDEYLGKSARFGPWRDTFVRIHGPAVEGLQWVFLEDWYFTTEETFSGPDYFPAFPTLPGRTPIQVVHSGPDLEYKAIRETYFAAILNGRKRVWVASPYFVPDAGLRDALMLAARSGVDVRFLGLFRPDKWIPFLAARFYWTDVLAAGVKVYQYAAGMMHSKYLLVDGEWASVGSANLDNRSLLLNFEANCQIFDPAVVAELEQQFVRDLAVSVRIDPQVYAGRPGVARLAENAARLFSPIL